MENSQVNSISVAGLVTNVYITGNFIHGSVRTNAGDYASEIMLVDGVVGPGDSSVSNNRVLFLLFFTIKIHVCSFRNVSQNKSWEGT